ncbi:MAG: hypothetical protein GY703_16395 [Gammaproteobacteria bacterium]|nr:hypothetical protein [Gammaproteobacteria bacterium]
MIKGKIFIGFIALECLMLVSAYLHGRTIQPSNQASQWQAKRAVVLRLGLTDFALWTEARYTRHPSQADFFSAFQDFPASPDHFPAGSIIAPIHIPAKETP